MPFCLKIQNFNMRISSIPQGLNHSLSYKELIFNKLTKLNLFTSLFKAFLNDAGLYYFWQP